MNLPAGRDEHDKRCVRHADYQSNRTHTHLPAGIEGVRIHASIYLLHMSVVVYSLASNVDCRYRSLKKYLNLEARGSNWWLGLADLSFCTDQLMMPCSKYSSGGSTLNDTHGGDRWARVLCWKIGWLSEPLNGVDANCSYSTNLQMQTHGKGTKNPPQRKHTTNNTSAQRIADIV